jgi:hypothetical protein
MQGVLQPALLGVNDRQVDEDRRAAGRQRQRFLEVSLGCGKILAFQRLKPFEEAFRCPC